MGRFRRFIWMLTRRKPMDVSERAPTDLDRCLNTLDLTAMGVGATLGFGLYVLSGEVAAQKAGPGVVLSFMIAAIASTFSALCYAEFAAKVPKSGSAYAYSYITVGEFIAFVIGWNLTLEHVIGTASLARGYSGYLGSLFRSEGPANATSAPIEWLPEVLQGTVTHFDWLAFSLTMLVTGLLLLGVRVSSRFQITFATVNLLVVAFVFVAGLFKADPHNWRLSRDEIPPTAGSGGFLPFGLTGVIAGASTCFFAFVGFDGIAATAEEVKNPRKAIPNSILWTSAIIFVTYTAMSTIQTLIWPYWDQKQDAPLPYIFERLGMPLAKWTVLVGVLAALSTSFVGGFLPLPRILYAMARDGVIYRTLAKVNKRFKVPIVATVVGGLLIALLASVLNIDQLADMLSIGTLAAYSLVSVSVLLLRYEHRKPSECSNPLPVTIQEAAGERQLADNLALSLNGRLGLNGSGAHKGVEERPKEPPAGNTNGTGQRGAHSSGLTRSASSSGSSSSDLSSGPSSAGSGANSSCSSSGSSSSRSLLALFVDGPKMADRSERRPDEQTTHISRMMILLLVLVTTLLDFALVHFGPTLDQLEPAAVGSVSGLLLATLLLSLLLNRLPVAEPAADSFEVPLVPYLPLFSIVINTYLMLNLPVMTWIRFAVWMAIGFFIYFTYGIFESTGYKDSRCD